MTTQTYAVLGMTCEHCVTAVHSEVSDLDGVTGVEVTLAPGSASALVVTSTAPLGRAAIAAALDEAGDYTLAAD